MCSRGRCWCWCIQEDQAFCEINNLIGCGHAPIFCTIF
nr:MAG TPA: hypothetical protein [Bacteriophage sp.]